MKQKTSKEYIEEGDFEGALKRFENANKRWKDYWFNTCEIIYNSFNDFTNKYILDPVKKIITKINQQVKLSKKWQNKIQVECDLLDNAKEKCYLFEFYDSKNNLVCSKVGTTKRKVIQRLQEEMRSKTYTNLDCVKAIVKRVYDCGDMPAEGAESYFRAYYIKQFPNSFKKNDRFMNEYFDFDFADKLMEKYLEKGLTN